MGGATLPTASTPGYTSFRGFVTCVCLAEWLPVYERLLLAKGLIKSNIDLWQLTGGAAASGGTHTQGGAFDLLYQTSPAHVAVAREMGAPGTWGRTVAQDFSRDHTHGVLSGCPHNGPAAYQVTAQRRGYNGLGQGYYNGQLLWGYGHKDEYPDPLTYRNWQQGIAWAESEITKLAPVVKEDDMANVSDAQLDRLLKAADRVLGGIPAGSAYKRAEKDGTPTRVLDSADGSSLRSILEGIAKKVGAPIDVDEAAIAAAIAPQIGEAVKSALAAGVPTDQLADAVVARLGERLAPPA